MTNADRIRHMADEQLVEFLTNGEGLCSCCVYRSESYGCKEVRCKEGILKWLEQGVSDDN